MYFRKDFEADHVFKKTRCSQEEYWDMLEALPPRRWECGVFLVGEANSHTESGRATYTAYEKRNGRHYRFNDDMTVSEFERLIKCL